jgi:hypothetical protein
MEAGRPVTDTRPQANPAQEEGAGMQRFAIKRTGLLAVAVGALAVGGLLVVASRGETQGNQQPFSNGGAKEWVAFDPLIQVVSNNQSVNIIRIVRVVNTSTVNNTYTITYERPSNPTRINICSGSLKPGEAKVCGGVGRASNGMVDGYFLVRASQPVIMGGYIDLPVTDYEERGGDSVRLKFQSRGTLQRLSYDWEPGCPPRAGNGCPDGRPVLTPGR